MPSDFSRPALASGINPAFLARYSIVVIDRDANSITIEMPAAASPEVIASLQFATGCKVRIAHADASGTRKEVLNPVAINALPDGDEPLILALEHIEEPAMSAPLHIAAPATNAHSLLDEFSRWIGGAVCDPIGLAPLASALRTGLQPSEAAETFSLQHSDAQQLPEPTLDVTRELRAGKPLDRALEDAGSVPPWLVRTIAAAPDSEAQTNAFAQAVDLESIFAGRLTRGRTALVELTALWGLVAAIWAVHSWLAAAMVIIAGAWLASRFRALGSRRADNAPVAAHILALVAALCGQKYPPRQAIRCGFMRLAAITPTWGKLPDSREELARALGSDALQHAALMRGELADVAARGARDRATIGDAALERLQWFSRCSAMTLAAAAIALWGLI